MDFFRQAPHGVPRVAGRIVGAVVIGLIAAGCTPAGSSPTPSATPTPATSPAEAAALPTAEELGAESNPVAVAQRFYDAILNNEDAALCQLLVPAYRDALIRTQGTATCPEASAKAFAEIRAKHQQTPLQFKANAARVAPDGQSAIVHVSGGPAPQKGRGKPTLSDSSLPLVRSGINWLVNPPTQGGAPNPG